MDQKNKTFPNPKKEVTLDYINEFMGLLHSISILENDGKEWLYKKRNISEDDFIFKNTPLPNYYVERYGEDSLTSANKDGIMYLDGVVNKIYELAGNKIEDLKPYKKCINQVTKYLQNRIVYKNIE